jgi:hypothetical protein
MTSKYRKLAIISINFLILGWLIKVITYDDTSDMIGFFSVLTLLFLIVYNVYIFLIQKVYPKNEKENSLIEIGFILLLLLPIMLLWFFTS